MIYDKRFLQYLKDNLGDPIRVTGKNIICRCPWHEYDKKQDHYHLYISVDAPIFHCFHATCGQSGFLNKLVRKIEGHDISEQFVDKEKLDEYIKKRVDFERTQPIVKEAQIPPLGDERLFSHKARYLRNRLKFTNINLQSIKGLVFDIREFIYSNRIDVDPKLKRLLPYIHANFIGFVTEYNSVLIMRNIDPKASFRYFKIDLYQSRLLDYYKLPGSDKSSRRIVLGEGVFDIFTEHIFDSLELMRRTHTYASGLAGSYLNLIKSVMYHEQIFRPEVVILSDSNIPLKKYRQMKKYNSHLIENLTVYYNRAGVDFNVTPIIAEKFIL